MLLAAVPDPTDPGSTRASNDRFGDMDAAIQTYIDRIYDVPGFFTPLDAALFAQLADAQASAGIEGDVLEIGCFYGQSAILLGYLTGQGESLHVCDLFEQMPPTEAGRKELAGFTGTMPTRADFESWFRHFHDELPMIHQGPSNALSPTVLGSSRFRFVHVDGSHTYEAVAQDIALARELATEGAIVVFDDFANVGHPGVAAALWPAIDRREFEPFASSPSKLYATVDRGHAGRYRETAHRFATLGGNRWKLNELRESLIVTLWPSNPRRSVASRVAGRIRRVLRHAWVTTTSMLQGSSAWLIVQACAEQPIT